MLAIDRSSDFNSIVARSQTLTGELTFQPFAPSGVWLTVMVGLIVSILTVSVPVFEFPAWSDTSQLTAWIFSTPTASTSKSVTTRSTAAGTTSATVTRHRSSTSWRTKA